MKNSYIVPLLIILTSCSHSPEINRGDVIKENSQYVNHNETSKQSHEHALIKHDISASNFKSIKSENLIDSFNREVGIQDKYETNSEYQIKLKKFGEGKGIFLVCDKIKDHDIAFSKETGETTWSSKADSYYIMPEEKGDSEGEKYDKSLLTYPTKDFYTSYITHGKYIATNAFGAAVDVNAGADTTASFILDPYLSTDGTLSFISKIKSHTDIDNAKVCYAISLVSPYVVMTNQYVSPTLSNPESTSVVFYYFRVVMHDVFLLKIVIVFLFL